MSGGNVANESKDMEDPAETACPWPEAPPRPRLEAGTCHVWRVTLDVPEALVERLHGHLAADERERAARYHHHRDRRRFVVCRGAQRIILGRYLILPPEQVRFRYGPRGKPAVDATKPQAAIHFNATGSQELALIALSGEHELGVDVECLRRLDDLGQLARRNFSARETHRLESLPSEQRLAAFFRCWTRKEAMLKALGAGLSFPLSRVEVTLAPDEPARLLSLDEDTAEAGRWTLYHLETGPGSVGALAMRAAPCRLRCWRFSWETKGE